MAYGVMITAAPGAGRSGTRGQASDAGAGLGRGGRSSARINEPHGLGTGGSSRFRNGNAHDSMCGHKFALSNYNDAGNQATSLSIARQLVARET
jgi:hypothetical protein